MTSRRRPVALAVAGIVLCLGLAVAFVTVEAQSTYYPPKGEWARKAPAELGLDPAKLQAAIDWATSHETRREMDFSDQEKTFGSLLGSVPNIRARTNGVIIYKGYVVGEWGDTSWADPTYSVAKSMLSTVASIAVRDGLITNLTDPVGALVKDGGYDSPANRGVTWKHHLNQESEWEGTMWGKFMMGNMLSLNGEEHRRIRSNVAHAFTPRHAHRRGGNPSLSVTSQIFPESPKIFAIIRVKTWPWQNWEKSSLAFPRPFYQDKGVILMKTLFKPFLLPLITVLLLLLWKLR